MGLETRTLTKKISDPLLRMMSNCPEVGELLRGSLLVMTKSPGVSGTHLIYFGRLKSWLDHTRT